MTSPEPRRRLYHVAAICLFAVVVAARPGLASTLTFTAVHTNYQPGATSSLTISDTITAANPASGRVSTGSHW